MSRTSLTLLLSLAALCPAAAAAGPIYSVTDISHEFTFYFDGRFATNYLSGPGNIDVRNWGTLHKFDFSRVNLAVVQAGASPCPFVPKDIAAVRTFLEEGGGVIVLGDYARFREEKTYRLNELAKPFGAEFVGRSAEAPLTGAGELKGKPIKTYNGRTIRLGKPAEWEVLSATPPGRSSRPAGRSARASCW